MKLFSIRDLQRFSGIKVKTLRVWELRYTLFNPVRTKGNIRLYSLDDVHRLLAIALLQQEGYRIHTLSRLSIKELEHKIQRVTNDESKQYCAVRHLIYYMYTDIEKFEDVLDAGVLYWGIEISIKKIILPFLEKAALLSYRDNSFETHFVVTAIRKKIILGIEKGKEVLNADRGVLLFLQEGEHFDLFLLYMCFALKQKGKRVFYLGTNVSTQNLQRFIEEKNPQELYSFIPQNSKFKLHDFAAYLDIAHPELPLTVITCDGFPCSEVSGIQFIHYRSWIDHPQENFS
jgi:DNA-binding transcriptional MerR regulator